MRRGAFVGAVVMLLAACAKESPGESPGATLTQTPTASRSTPVDSQPARAAEWREIVIEGEAPAAREDHTWTVSPDGATGYLFGGRDGANILGDLWAYELGTSSWSRVITEGGPPARFGHSAVWVPGVGLVIFAGQAGATFFNDLWAYEPAANSWRLLPADGARPVPRYGSCAAIGRDQRLWISHGFTSEGQRFADTWSYDFAAGTWMEETPAGDLPRARCLHACWWTNQGTLTLYGGQTTGITALGDRWILTPGVRPGTNAWSMVDQDQVLPGERNLYAAARWAGATVIFGGQSNEAFLQDAWVLPDGGADLPIEAGSPPPARSAAELIGDTVHDRLLLFGGKDADRVLGDLWELTLP